MRESKKTKKKSVDEEGLYSDTESLEVPSDSSYDSDLASYSDSDCYFDSDCSDSNLECNPDDEILDEDEDSTFAYDADDLCIDMGVMFPYVDQCMSALKPCIDGFFTRLHIIHFYGFNTLDRKV
jgi:hypothetical protein